MVDVVASGPGPRRIARHSDFARNVDLACAGDACRRNRLIFFLRRFTDSTVPNWDALTTALSLAATYGQTKKLLESWLIWILVDVIYVPLYIYKGLWLTSALYAIFMILCVVGLRAWQRALTAD
jgi:nicotinamide mononucleotide transporter